MYLNKMNVEHKTTNVKNMHLHRDSGIIIIHTFPIRNNNKLQTT